MCSAHSADRSAHVAWRKVGVSWRKQWRKRWRKQKLLALFVRAACHFLFVSGIFSKLWQNHSQFVLWLTALLGSECLLTFGFQFVFAVWVMRFGIRALR